MTEVGTVQKVCCQREVVFDWKVENFSTLSDTIDSYYYSPEFEFCGLPWYLQLYPNGERDEESEGCIGLYLMVGDSGPPIEVRYSLGIRTTEGDTEVVDAATGTFGENDCCWGSERSIGRSELLHRRSELLPQDVLTLTATLKLGKEVALNNGTKNVSVQTTPEENVADDLKGESPEKTGPEKVLQDIVKLWISGDNSDVVLQVRGEEFKVHRTILSARTPVLCAMFQHDTAEKASGEVTIDDCEPAIFEQLLHYIYTGAPRVLTAENACALYVVADKYLVKEVKTLCVRCMQDTVCLNTFCNIVKLSLIHREDELLKTATDFLSKNMINVMKTVEWQRFLRDHSTWANEITIRAMELIEARNK